MRTATSRAATLHATQTAYLAAVIAHDGAVKAANDECAVKGYVIVDGQEDGEAFEAACDGIDTVTLAHKVYDFWQARMLATYTVVEWFIDACIAARPAEAVLLTTLRARVRGTMTNAKLKELIALAMKYRGE